MCGIFGVLAKSKNVSEQNITKIDEILSTRGPDDSSTFNEEGVFFLHRRLSVRDTSSNGKQPMVSSCGRFVICYNGEYYNTSEMRENLSKNGIHFRGHSDTEVLLESIAKNGIDEALSQLNGMFAFSVYDKKEEVVYIARDRIGIKPLFYNANSESVIFSSDLRAVSKSSYFKETLSKEGVYKFLKSGYIKGPTTAYNNVYKLKPGTYLKIKLSDLSIETKEYWSLKSVYKNTKLVEDYETCKNELHNLLKSSIDYRMITDVPLGVFLSGGVDSSLVTGVMQSLSSTPINTFSIGFHDRNFNEAQFAKEVAQHLGTNHTELYLDDKDCLDVVESLPTIYSEPFADASQIPTILVSKLARQKVTVALGGDGGDELFLGYNRYHFATSMFRKISRLPMPLRKSLAAVIASLPPSFYKASGAALRTASFNKVNIYDPATKFYKLGRLLSCQNLNDFYDVVTSQIALPDDYLKEDVLISPMKELELTNRLSPEILAYQDILEYLVDDILVKTDKASMGMSLEARVPFLDHRIVEYSASIPFEFKYQNGVGKYILRDILSEYVPTRLFERPKMGFSVPLSDWLKGSLKELLCDTLSADRLNADGVLDPIIVNRRMNDHFSGKKDNSYVLWNLLMFQMWYDKERSI